MLMGIVVVAAHSCAWTQGWRSGCKPARPRSSAVRRAEILLEWTFAGFPTISSACCQGVSEEADNFRRNGRVFVLVENTFAPVCLPQCI